MVAALPLVWMGAKMPPRLTAPGFRWQDEWTLARELLYEYNDYRPLLWGARAATLVWPVLLFLALALWSRQLWGRRGAVLATLLATCEPNLLAHSGLVTTDLGAAALVCTAVYTLWRYQQEPSLIRLLLVGLTTGAALAAKFTCILLLPILAGLLLLGERGSVAGIGARVPGLRRLARAAGRFGVLVVLVVLVVFAVYGFTVGCVVPRGSKGLPGVIYAARLSPASVWLATRVPVPAPDYFMGLCYVRADQIEGRETFLAGEIFRYGSLWYFPIAFLVKVPLPLLVILLGAPFCSGARLCGRDKWFLGLPALVLIASAIVSRLNLGFRYLLPAMPFLLLYAGRWASGSHSPRSARTWVLATCALWLGWESAAIHPHYLAYFNQLGGGPKGGSRYLVDSNLDWGQDLPGLQRYVEQNGIQRVWLSYFGSAPPRVYVPLAEPLYPESPPRLQPGDDPQRCIVAVSATNLRMMGPRAQHRLWHRPRSFDWLLRHQPVATIGYSIYVYRVPPEW